MSEPTPVHLDDDDLEAYALGRLREPALANVEEHLLICEVCRTRLDEHEDYARSLRSALRELAGEEGKDRTPNGGTH